MHAKASVLLGEATAVAASYAAGTLSSYPILSYLLGFINYLPFGYRPRSQPNARVSSASRDVGRTPSTVF